MKKIILLTTLILLIILEVALHAEGKNIATSKTITTISKTTKPFPTKTVLVAYYFHGNVRCVSCKKIEDYTQEALGTFFYDEISSGAIDYQVINIDQPENKHYVNDYQLYTKSVILSKVENGEELEFKNLDQVWNLLRNKEKFQQYIKNEVKNFIPESKD